MIGATWVLWGCPSDEKSQPVPEKGPARDAQKELPPVREPEAPSALSLSRMARSVDPQTRRALARQLLGDEKARPWAAFGLGLSCDSENEQRVVAALASAVANWLSDRKPARLEELQAAAWSIGACASDQSEAVLASYLQPDPSSGWKQLAQAAALGLGAYADRRGRLSERTQSALLNAAARENDPGMLLALGRVARLSDAVGAHLLEVAGRLLTEGERGTRRAAIFALSKAGASAADPLAQVFLSKEFSASERSAAAQALAQLGPAGQEALDQVVWDMLGKGLPRRFDDPRWIPLRAALLGLERPKKSQKVLAQLASAPLSEDDSPEAQASRRRLVWLRCRAEDLRAMDRFDARGLLSCDPDRRRPFLLAQIRVLDRGRIDAAGAKRVAELAKHVDPVVAQAALRLYAGHAELPDARERLLVGLQSEVPGTQTTAARVIAAYPSRVFSSDSDAAPEELIEALGAILKSDKLPLETLSAASRAAGASRALTLKPLVEELCAAPHPALWESAEMALSLLGSPKKRCSHPIRQDAEETTPAGPVTLVAQSDVGELTLRVDAPYAPASAAHFLELVDAGFYDGLTIHAAREGFAVQLGDKNADGFDDERAPGLPHEVTPRPFEAFSFGMGAFSPGTAHSQIFVVVADAPQLTGARVRLGTASGPWDQLVVGDVIHSLARAPSETPVKSP